VQSAVENSSRERELNSLSNVTIIVVLATVTMTFGAMIAVFVYTSESNKFWGHLAIPGVLWVSTALLLASSGTLHRSRRDLLANQQTPAFRWMALTTGLALAFLVCQIAAWLQVLHSGVVLKTNPHSWFIFLFTALHGLHIGLGLGGLVYLLIRMREPVSGPKYLMKTRVVANGVSIFWHYLDFLWVLLFVLLLTWRR
jgi:cytochrome c oxidase subunit 3